MMLGRAASFFQFVRKLPAVFGDFFLFAFTTKLGAGLCLVTLVAGLILPASGMKLPLCSMYLSTGLPCPGCGLTRSVSSIMKGYFAAGWQYNPFGYLVAGIALLGAPMLFVGDGIREWTRKTLKPAASLFGILLMLLFIGFLAHGVTRMVMVTAGHEDARWWTSPGVPPAFAHLVPGNQPSTLTLPDAADQAPVPDDLQD